MFYDETLCPQHLRESLNDYVLRGIETGSFLRSVLENDLHQAVERADYGNMRLLPHIVAWIYMNVPANTWGSPEAVKRHLAKKREERAASRQPVPPTEP